MSKLPEWVSTDEQNEKFVLSVHPTLFSLLRKQQMGS